MESVVEMSSDSSYAARSSNFISEGDVVVLYSGMDTIDIVTVRAKDTFHTKLGNFPLKALLQKEYGSRVFDSHSGRWLAALRPSAAMIAKAGAHRTQVLYHADISLILVILDVKPGRVIMEAGTGSGTLTVALGKGVAPDGNVHTFEYHESRCIAARRDTEQHKLHKIVSVYHRNVINDGFPEELRRCGSSSTEQKDFDGVDGVTLDLPECHSAIAAAATCLRVGGTLVTYCPCIEQVQLCCATMRTEGFSQIRTFEVFSKPWVTYDGAKKDAQYELAASRKRPAATGMDNEPVGVADHPLDKKRQLISGDAVDEVEGCPGESNRRADESIRSEQKPLSREGAAVPARSKDPVQNNRPQWRHLQGTTRGHTGYVSVGTLAGKGQLGS